MKWRQVESLKNIKHEITLTTPLNFKKNVHIFFLIFRPYILFAKTLRFSEENYKNDENLI